MLALALVAAASSFSAQAQDESETTVVEVYKSDMVNWTFEKVAGAHGWEELKTNEYFDDCQLTEKEQETCGFDNGICVEYDDNNDTDAWAISPAIKLEADIEYVINIYLKSVQGGDGENLRIMAAKDATVDALKAGTECLDVNGYDTFSLMKQDGSFTPTETGDYYFGVQCYSNAENFGLIATGFTISYEQTSGVSVVVADENGVMEYFDLQGRKVETPSTGLYICRQGDNVKKVVIK